MANQAHQLYPRGLDAKSHINLINHNYLYQFIVIKYEDGLWDRANQFGHPSLVVAEDYCGSLIKISPIQSYRLLGLV